MAPTSGKCGMPPISPSGKGPWWQELPPHESGPDQAAQRPITGFQVASSGKAVSRDPEPRCLGRDARTTVELRDVT
jgi:hypothetical protein